MPPHRGGIFLSAGDAPPLPARLLTGRETRCPRENRLQSGCVSRAEARRRWWAEGVEQMSETRSLRLDRQQ